MPIKKGKDTLLFPIVKRWTIKKLTITKSKLWEKSLPSAKPKRKIGLSIISGSIAPIINENLLILNCFTRGISVNIKGTAIWNIG